jgi:Zn-dependent protease
LGDKRFAVSNTAIAVFNLLPIESTDGHNALRSVLSICLEGEKIKAALNIISAAFLFLMYCFGFMLFLKSGYNFSALAVSVYLTVKFLFQGSRPYR